MSGGYLMTVEEFYDWCSKQNLYDFKIYVDEISVNGCFIGYKELQPDRIDISYSEKIISLGWDDVCRV